MEENTENPESLNLGAILGNLGNLKLDNLVEVFGDLGDSLAENVVNRIEKPYLIPILGAVERLNNTIAKTNQSLNKLVDVLKKK